MKEVFGDVDKAARTGKIASEMPAWYHRTQIDNLKEEIAKGNRELKSGAVPADRVPGRRQEIANFEQRLEAIEGSRPHVSDQERTKLQKQYRVLGGLIQDMMFTRDEMMKGTADAHEEARRMSEPTIEIDKTLQGLAATCNVPVTKGMVTRDGASKIWKIIGRLIDEPTNAEVLRRDSIYAPVYAQGGTAAG